MARYKDGDWNLPEPSVQNWEQASVAILMDIRDELKKLNHLLRCRRFQDIPNRLNKIIAAIGEKK